MAGKFWSFMAKVGLAEEVETDAAEQPVPAHPSSPPVQAVPTKTVPHSAAVPDAETQARLAELDKTARVQLAQAMESAGAALVEELGDLLETLKESIEDEKIRYVTALKILMKKGHSVGAICQDMDKCIGVLEEKDREFSATLKAQFDKRVGSKAQIVEQCNSRVKAIKEQIATLEQEMSTVAAQAHEAHEGVAEEQRKLTQVQDRFGMAYRAIRSEVESQRAKVAQYGEKL